MATTGNQKLVFLMLICMVAATAIVPRADAVVSCSEVFATLYPCANYVLYGGTVPGECCSGLSSLVSSLTTTPDRQAACACLKAVAGSANSEQLTRAAGLPGVCGVQLPFEISPNIDCSQIVTSICKRTVVSTMPVQPGKFCPLSVLDRIMENNTIRIIFYYREFGENVKMDEPLAETLNAYTIVMGRLLRSPGDEWMIRCNDAGMRVIDAKAKGSVDQWLLNLDRNKELKLAHWEPMSSEPYFWSPFYIQITEFEEGGVAIGLSCTHLLADPNTATLLIKTWADIAFAGKMLTPPHFHPLPPRRPADNNITNPRRINTRHHLISHYEKLTATQKQSPGQISPPEKQTTITLLFTDEMVRMCVLMAKSSGENGPAGAFDALAGLFWSRISKARNNVGLMDLTIGLDVRKLMGLDKGYFGNCMVYKKVEWSPEYSVLDDDLLSQAANAIRNVVKETNKEEIIDLIEWLEQNNCQACNVLDGCDSLVCVNLEGLDSYSACFGVNFDPVHVSYYIEPEAGPGYYKLFILPAPPETGPLSRILMVTLPENEAAKLMEDQLIQQLSPCIKMEIKN